MAVAPKHNALDILRRLVPLNTLSDAGLEALLGQASFEKVKKDHCILEKGDTDHFNVYLLSGQLAMLSNGREVDSVRAGSDTARFPIAHQVPRKYTVIAKTRAEIVRIDNRQLGELLAKTGNTAYEVSEVSGESDDDWMSQLLASPVFQQIPAANIQSVMMRMREQPVSEGDVIINYGDEGDFFYLINKGRCSIKRPLEEGGEELVEIAQLGSGDSFGEEALLSGKPRSSTVEMISDGLLLRLSKEDFVQFVKQPLAHNVTAEKALELSGKGAVLLDVRTSQEYEANHLPDSVSLPFSSLRYQASTLDPDHQYIVYCNDGLQSATAAYLLTAQGFHVVVLEGGIAGASSELVELIEEVHEAPLEPEDESNTEKMVAFLRQELAVAQEAAREQKQQLNNFKLAFDEAKELMGRHQQGEKSARLKAQQHQKELTKLKGELSALLEQRAAKTDLEKQKAELEKELHEANERLASSILSNEEVQSRFDELQKRVDESASQEKQHLSTIAEMESRLAEQSTLGEKIQALEEDLKQSQAQTEQLQSEKSTLAEQHSSEQSEAEQLHKTAVEKLEHSLSDLAQEKESVNKRVSELESQVQQQAELNDQLENAQKELADSQKQIEQLQGEKDALQSDMTQSHAAALEELNNALLASQQEKEASDQRNIELEAKVAESIQIADQKAQLENERSELKQLIEQMQGDNDALQSDMAQSHAIELEELNSALLASRQEREAADQRNVELEAKLTESVRIADQKAQLEKELAEAVEKSQRVQQALSAAEKSVQSGSERISELEGQITAKESASDQQLVEREGVEAELHSLTENLSKANGQLETLETDNANLVKRQAELEKSLEERSERVAQLESELQAQAEEGGKQTALQQEQADAQLQQANDRVAELEAESQALAKQVEAQQEQNDAVKQEAESREKELSASLEALGAQQEERDRQIAAFEVELEKSQEQHQQQLQEAREETERLEKALADTRQAMESGADSDSTILQAELTTLTSALEAADQDNDRLRKELEEAQKVPSDADAGASDAIVAKEKRKRELAEQEAMRLSGEVDQLRSVMETYADQIQNLQTAGDNAELDALRSELDLVRERADSDVAELKEALQEAKNELQQQLLTDSVDASENEAIRDDVQALQEKISERDEELERLKRNAMLFQEKLTARDDKIEQLKVSLENAQVDADEAEFHRDEAIEAKKLVDDALYKLQKDLHSERGQQDLADSRLAKAGPSRALDLHALTGAGSLIKGIIVGVLVTFGAAEILSIGTGRGELIGHLLNGDAKEELFNPGEKLSTVDDQPDSLSIDTPDGMKFEQRVAVSAVSTRGAGAQNADQSTTVSELQSERENLAVEESPEQPEPVVAQSVPGPPQRAVSNEPETGRVLRDRMTDGGFAPDLLYIRGGSFVMGSDRSQLDSNESPAHRVSLSSFAIGRFEVTFDEYQRFAEATERSLPDDAGWGRGKRPVINVSHEDARAYADWLSLQTGRRYRLPTEAEWEYAASGGSESYFWWGYDSELGRANCFNCGTEWDGASTAPVGLFQPNGFGLHNTAGNVMEWTEDCYHSNYRGAPANGFAWSEPDCSVFSTRGGGFNKPDDSLRTTKRSGHDKNAKLPVIGFRIAREVRY